MIMRNFVFSILAFAGVLLMVSCNKKADTKADNLQNTIDSLILVNAHTKADYEETIRIINEIQTSLAEIKTAEKFLIVNNNMGDDIDSSAKTQIVDDITNIANILKENKKKISSLQKQLKNSKNESAELKEMINSLNSTLNEKTQEIAKLQEELAKRDIKIAELDDVITSLTQINESQTEVINSQNEELNKVYYAFGTSKELREQKIIEKRGRNLLKGDFNHDYFTSCDLRETTSLPLGCKNAEILTSHPNSSYSLNKDENGFLTLNISNPQEFWSTSRYLVVEVE